MKRLPIYLLLMGMFVFQSCIMSSSASSEKLKEISLKEKTLIVDVRSPEEFAEGHIENSINVPLEIVADSLELYQRYDDLILVCRSGNRSGMAMQILEEKGLTNLYNGGGWDYLDAIIKEEE